MSMKSDVTSLSETVIIASIRTLHLCCRDLPGYLRIASRNQIIPAGQENI